MDRKEAIKYLKIIKGNLNIFPEVGQKEKIQALGIGIASLQTDEAYQLEYEGREVYTKDEVVDMLKSIQKQIGKYYRIRCEDVHAIIQNKINELGGDE